MNSASLTYLRPDVAALKKRMDDFVELECIPAEAEYEAHMKDRNGADRWTMEAVPPCINRLKNRARELGLWNLFVPPHLISRIPERALAPAVALSYREYGILCESLGRAPTVAPEACNTSAPDTGNMEVFLEFGTPAQKTTYLIPLLQGQIRSAFLMTEPDVASSDPTNLETKLTKKISNGTVEYILTGRKWWSTGAMDPRCRVALVVAKMDYSDPSCQAQPQTSKHGAHTIVAVPLPHPQVIMQRPLTVFGYDDAPHGHAEVVLNGVRLDESDLIFGEGSGFRVSQARLGPGRIHHCMRALGIATRSYELMLQRTMERKTFGKYLWEHGGCQDAIADSASDLEAARLLTLSCAAAMDDVGVKNARDKIGIIKVTVPELTYRVVDRAIQVFGGAGVHEDLFLARALAGLRTLRIADGPDAVHRRTVALMEIKKRALRGSQHSRL
ncbi:acyl-coenzyme A dehydrogenase [Phaeodactylum tricornutum CCAP 1055/1]|jgi:acyl-CoA dehydrogenase|uniref:Acyl-coenzyme A dehydrogenase n=2 Tax=Phaeodactylum tricornutum TaxID=2850 RepID=B7FPZ6_PHATC|nr:acyl-coenzyme A dehydrogenase [Phaeodactylum tricornutum CCAP 1055/1]EEC51259.1 acyl-coenzyme A dehydrogenase [Phaeodactylum tricornutum CCAP 1055/1]|eukprot:XP_002176796.1 acyl-coenzyme A dehydrogenase [Phaeodactylum tricornutum CCAP 1055/1]